MQIVLGHVGYLASTTQSLNASAPQRNIKCPDGVFHSGATDLGEVVALVKVFICSYVFLFIALHVQTYSNSYVFGRI